MHAVNTVQYVHPRWLGRISSCLLTLISRVQFSPSAHTRRDFFLHKNWLAESARERELATFDENRRPVGMLNPVGDQN